MAVKIALAGNPNSGKTTMFNELTGSTQHVGNWPGVTVEKKDGKLKSNKEVVIQDLPGIYSLSPYTLEEVVSRNYLINEKPDAIINIVDASNIERNLYLTTQLMELGVPMVLALNMIDVVQKNGDIIDLKKLGEILGCEVVETSATKGIGTKEVTEKAMSVAKKGGGFKALHRFSEDVESVLDVIAEKIKEHVAEENLRWYAIKVFERDQEVRKNLKFPKDLQEQIEKIIQGCEEQQDDDSESIITNERYTYIAQVIQKCVKIKNKGALSTSDKIDQIVTNRWLGLPIFAVVMFLVYFLSISTVGTAMTDWVNEAFFDEGWFVLGMGAEAFEDDMEEFEIEQVKIEAFLEEAEEQGYEVDELAEVLEMDPEEEENFDALFDTALEEFMEQPGIELLSAVAEIEDEETHEVIEEVPVDFEEFMAAMTAEEPDPSDYGPFVPGLPEVVEGALESIGTADWLISLICDGIIAGVGAILGFLPQMLVLFLLLAILEDCGYMARIAFVLDRVFRKFGLSGKSFIPMLISTGCAVPGIMASRTIENDGDRRMTVMTTSFMPCGAKLPIIALFAGALFPGSIWVGPSAYFVGMASIIVSGIMLKKTRMFSGEASPFVMELPAYHMPRPKGVLRTMIERGWSFVKKAGTIILLATVLIWFLSSFNWSMEMVDTNDSMLASIGNVLAPIFVPLGFGDWRAAVATVSGLIAKENVVGTLGVLFGLAEVAEDGYEIWGQVALAFTQLSAYSYLLFNLLCAPCFAAIGALRREMMSAKWTAFAITYQCVFAYAVSLMVYQIGMLVQGNGFRIGTVVAFLLVAFFLYMLFRKPSADRPAAVNAAQGAMR